MSVDEKNRRSLAGWVTGGPQAGNLVMCKTQLSLETDTLVSCQRAAGLNCSNLRQGERRENSVIPDFRSASIRLARKTGVLSRRATRLSTRFFTESTTRLKPPRGACGKPIRNPSSGPRAWQTLGLFDGRAQVGAILHERGEKTPSSPNLYFGRRHEPASLGMASHCFHRAED
jgi:hypothetical protein